MFKVENNILLPYLNDNGINIRSQDLEQVYVANGYLYLISPLYLRQRKSFFSGVTKPLIIRSDIESLDIDTEYDWNYAEYCIKSGLVQKAHLHRVRNRFDL